MTLFTLAADGSDLKRLATITSRVVLRGGGAPYWLQIQTLAWSPDGTHIAIYTPRDWQVLFQLFTVARDGSDRRDLIRLDDNGILMPASPPDDE